MPWRMGLILGGARSGKTRLALRIGQAFPAPRFYLATAEADPADPEFQARIERHRRDRQDAWHTIETGFDLAESLTRLPRAAQIAVVDCLTLWLSRLVAREASDGHILQQVDGLLEAVARCPAPVVFVSSEVGLGVVPMTPVGRRFRDMAGWLHQRFAEQADWVVFAVAGLPVWLKGDAGLVLGPSTAPP
ncbi:MAG: bifunctional adenosylcobinamide kinase/adenosylcobinamide-phosphate guanylyltransferase [Acidobacteria bacterium]|nr:bifunctional adenosylcobinamide kinase/adenosylcobinamide-phosphate guanylyltransferase [Acidobacteriota bacterium]MDW7984040.1 bifunctional adenosylcobinamide kinase/adenosylcobinamide-phosphate guanylyltransferase [Acidobacteriota bacterium]